MLNTGDFNYAVQLYDPEADWTVHTEYRHANHAIRAAQSMSASHEYGDAESLKVEEVTGPFIGKRVQALCKSHHDGTGAWIVHSDYLTWQDVKDLANLSDKFRFVSVEDI